MCIWMIWVCSERCSKGVDGDGEVGNGGWEGGIGCGFC